MEIIKNRKGGRTLLADGYVYFVDKENNGKIIWRCQERHTCKARVHTEEDSITKRINEHTHAPSAASASL